MSMQTLQSNTLQLRQTKEQAENGRPKIFIPQVIFFLLLTLGNKYGLLFRERNPKTYGIMEVQQC